jgi:hypothetical protein
MWNGKTQTCRSGFIYYCLFSLPQHSLDHVLLSLMRSLGYSKSLTCESPSVGRTPVFKTRQQSYENKANSGQISTLSHSCKVTTGSGFGGLGVSALDFDTQVRCFKPGRSRRIFQGEKILSAPSFGTEVKPWVPCRRFMACKRSLGVSWKTASRQN